MIASDLTVWKAKLSSGMTLSEGDNLSVILNTKEPQRNISPVYNWMISDEIQIYMSTLYI